MAGEAAEPNRRCSARRRATAASSGPLVSRHPCASTIDAATIEIGRLRTLLESPEFSERVDFVNLSDGLLRQLFVTVRILRTAGVENEPEKLLMPPPSRRRTLTQLQQWFELGNGQRRQLMEQEANATIIPSLDDDAIYWNGAWRDRPPRLPSDEVTCSGINRSFVYGLGDYYTDEQRRVLDDGLCHTFREGMANRVQASHPNPADDTWSHPSSVVGELFDMNNPTDIRCIVVEADHRADEHQFDFMSIHDAHCSFGPVDEGRSLCQRCHDRWRWIKDHARRNVEIRERGYHPATRLSILTRSASLQKRSTEYHRSQQHSKGSKILVIIQ